jgi:hypothetical protein
MPKKKKPAPDPESAPESAPASTPVSVPTDPASEAQQQSEAQHSAAAVIAELGRLRTMIPDTTKKNYPKLDAETVLARIAKMRGMVPWEKFGGIPKIELPKEKSSKLKKTKTLEDFAWEAVIEALNMFQMELSTALQRTNERLTKQALDIYYIAEELAKDPEQAHLIPFVEKMRTAYENDFGKPIPPKKKE